MEHPMQKLNDLSRSLAPLEPDGTLIAVILVPPMGSVTIAFDADNPGRWAFHCHNLYHMMTGMMTEVRYPGTI
jgi:FtsP/CotA-like multicopper oxidase with cupredoxin domain